MLKEFKEFILQGNVLDLAVAVVIGGAFTAIVNALVEGFITPLVGLILSLVPGVSGDSLSTMSFAIRGVSFNYGSIINAIITFLITAFVIFMLVKAVNKASNLRKKVEEEEAAEPEATEALLIEIRDLLAKNNK